MEYAVCGGLAVVIHGHVRATKDIDLLVPTALRDSALAALARLGFDLLALPMTFDAGNPTERRVQRVSKLVENVVVTVDLLFVEPSFGEVWVGRETFERDGKQIGVVSREGLIAMKRIAGRAQDLADIEALERGANDA